MGDNVQDPAEELEESPEDAKRRHRVLMLAFQQLAAATTHRSGNITESLSSGDLTAAEWSEELARELTGAHAEAAMIGRRMAGETSPMSLEDLAYGADIWKSQQPYLDKFVQDIEAGRYGDPGGLNAQSIDSRVAKYIRRLKGTVNDSWLDSLHERHEYVNWVDVGDERECADCPALAAASPHRIDQLERTPGDCSTQCWDNCRCYLETVDGLYSTQGI